MRKFYFLLLVFLPGLVQAQWVQQTSGTTNQLWTVYAADANIAWTAGANSTILKTTNGGTTWTDISSFTGPLINSIQFLSDKTTGYLTTSFGEVRKSTNGGTSWTIILPSGTIQPQEVKFFNSAVGIVVGRDGSDVGGFIQYTFDGGTTWSSITADPGYKLTGVDFGSDANNAWVVGYDLSGTGDFKVYKLVNPGNNTFSLSTQATFNTGAIGFTSIDMVSNSTGFIGGGFPQISKTSNGSSWVDQGVTFDGDEMVAISAFDASHIIAVNFFGRVVYSINGSTWAEQNIGTIGFRDVFAFDQNTVYAVGNNGAIFKNATILPITLSSFTAQTQNKKVLLNWSTSTELNNKGFTVLRKPTTGGDWEQVGYVNSKGNSNQIQNYSLTDEPKGGSEFLYQLKQTDIDGKFTFSNILKVKLEVDNIALSNYPNPFSKRTTINYSLPKASSVQLLIRNQFGQIIKMITNEKQQAGNYAVTLYTSSWASGNYFAELNTNEKKVRMRLAVMN